MLSLACQAPLCHVRVIQARGVRRHIGLTGVPLDVGSGWRGRIEAGGLRSFERYVQLRKTLAMLK